MKIIVGASATLVVILLVIAGVYGWHFGKISFDQARVGANAFSAGANAVKAGDFSKATSYFSDASQSFVLAENTLKNLSFLNQMPWLSQEYASVESIFSSGAVLGRTASHLAAFGEELAKPLAENRDSLNEIKPEVRREILKKLYEAPPVLAGAKAEINLSLLSLRSMPRGILSFALRDKLNDVEQKLEFLNQTLDDVAPLAELLPNLSGYPAPKT
ncbi:MAG: hypothetical protein Q8M83_02975, partial [bacterium]|nr:hypothetical protein [bacterium]